MKYVSLWSMDLQLLIHALWYPFCCIYPKKLSVLTGGFSKATFLCRYYIILLLYLHCCEGSRVLIGGFLCDHPFQSLDHRTAPHGWLRGNRRMAARRGHLQISVRWHRKHRVVIEWILPDLRSIACGFLLLHFRRWPTDRHSGIGRCPTGRRRMRKIGEASGGRWANFNCELNLPGIAGWVQDGCCIGVSPQDFCRIRATDRRALIRGSIWLYCDLGFSMVTAYSRLLFLLGFGWVCMD